MSHSSPASYLVWTLFCGLLNAFLLFHLWSFDRFKCLKWNSTSSGAFKRVMTYSYLVTIPMIFTYALGNMIIKYHEGFISHPVYGIIPKPSQLWEQSAQNTIFPLMLLFSIGWSFEMVTHLEELCFWLFLVNSGSSRQNWFQSPYFKTWIIGSSIAVIYMPLVTIFTRANPLKSEAFTFLAGSLGSLSLTLWFTPILWTFPSFLNNLRAEGVDASTIIRLTKFSELNTIRVVFRFLFTIPLLILGVDGVRPHNHINESMLWTDFLIMVAGFGCAISSGITLVIFFPRSIEGEIAARDAVKERKRTRSAAQTASRADTASTRPQSYHYGRSQPSGQLASPGGTYLLSSSPIKENFDFQSYEGEHHVVVGTFHPDGLSDKRRWDDEERDVALELPHVKQPKKKSGKDFEMNSLSEANLSVHNLRQSNVNPMISNFTSPIDLTYAGVDPKESRLTFQRR